MTSFIDIVRPKERTEALLFDCLSILGGSLLLALLAQVAIPLMFTPVLLTLQTLGVLLMGALLGKKRGAMAVLLYLAEGGLGLPVFMGGSSGLFGPTMGYLLGFVVAAYVVGGLLERGYKDNFFATVVAMSLGNLCVYAFGVLWLSFLVGGVKAAFYLGVLPFLATDALKVVIAAALVPSGWKLIRYWQ